MITVVVWDAHSQDDPIIYERWEDLHPDQVRNAHEEQMAEEDYIVNKPYFGT